MNKGQVEFTSIVLLIAAVGFLIISLVGSSYLVAPFMEKWKNPILFTSEAANILEALYSVPGDIDVYWLPSDCYWRGSKGEKEVADRPLFNFVCGQGIYFGLNNMSAGRLGKGSAFRINFFCPQGLGCLPVQTGDKWLDLSYFFAGDAYDILRDEYDTNLQEYLAFNRNYWGAYFDANYLDSSYFTSNTAGPATPCGSSCAFSDNELTKLSLSPSESLCTAKLYYTDSPSSNCICPYRVMNKDCSCMAFDSNIASRSFYSFFTNCTNRGGKPQGSEPVTVILDKIPFELVDERDSNCAPSSNPAVSSDICFLKFHKRYYGDTNDQSGPSKCGNSLSTGDGCAVIGTTSRGRIHGYPEEYVGLEQFIFTYATAISGEAYTSTDYQVYSISSGSYSGVNFETAYLYNYFNPGKYLLITNDKVCQGNCVCNGISYFNLSGVLYCINPSDTNNPITSCTFSPSFETMTECFDFKENVLTKNGDIINLLPLSLASSQLMVSTGDRLLIGEVDSNIVVLKVVSAVIPATVDTNIYCAGYEKPCSDKISCCFGSCGHNNYCTNKALSGACVSDAEECDEGLTCKKEIDCWFDKCKCEVP